MSYRTRFGRKILVPSTMQILHELRMMAAADIAAAANKETRPASETVPLVVTTK